LIFTPARTEYASIREPTAEEQAALEAVAALPDNEIDTSDIPEITNWTGAVRGARTKRGARVSGANEYLPEWLAHQIAETEMARDSTTWTTRTECLCKRCNRTESLLPVIVAPAVT
jgi:hypothetical protein